MSEGDRRNYASVAVGRICRSVRGESSKQGSGNGPDRQADRQTDRESEQAEQNSVLFQSFAFPMTAAAATSAPSLSSAIAFFATQEIRQSAAAASVTGTHGDRRQMRIRADRPTDRPTGKRAAKTFIYNTQRRRRRRRRRRSIGAIAKWVAGRQAKCSGFCSVSVFAGSRCLTVSSVSIVKSFLRARFRFGGGGVLGRKWHYGKRACACACSAEPTCAWNSVGVSKGERERRRRRQAARS